MTISPPKDARIIENMWCDHSCPHYAPYEHPYYHHCVWCWYLMKSLSFWDGTLAKCLREQPDMDLVRGERILGNRCMQDDRKDWGKK